MINYYGNLCTKMYEILHPYVEEEELQFYLSYAKQNKKILEPLCGSGRFVVPFYEKGFDITGFDMSEEMLKELYKKVPNVKSFKSSMENYQPKEKYDYIFITSGSFSLFLDEKNVENLLIKMKQSLNEGGNFVFAVETTANVVYDKQNYFENNSVKTEEGYDLVFKSKSFYDEKNKILSTPSIYELYDENNLLAKEEMDFRLKLYDFGELDELIFKTGFKKINVFSDFNKSNNLNKNSKMFLYDCYI
ncbi:class I SAM-dependent methyltransferase [Oceanotoga teriensis]|uniref:class I SAM-dependent methyltransferase n=1 Tax=Oceanotoga teriensis TaxID=515440 RepID=UPI00272DCFCE|nr:class I SAM-dependent methyltransferase [Oceanotoga teriensis]